MIVATALATTQLAAAEGQVHADVGLAVVGLGYEHVVDPHVSVQGEAQIFGTYFLPWFDAGDDVSGFGGQMRVTWFGGAKQTGVYLAPFLRIDRVKDDDGSEALGFCTGAVVGWAFDLGTKWTLRLGGGVQYMRYKLVTSDIDTPFITIDGVLGYRL